MANENIPNPQEEKDQISQMLVDTGNTILEHQEEEKAFRKHQQIEAEMIHQKYGDRIMKDEGLRAAFDSSIGTGADQSLGQAFLDPIHKYVRELHKDYIKFVKKEDSENRDKAFAKLKLLKQEVAAIKEMKRDYSDNMMGGEVGQPTISKGCSQQQVSIADQLYTQNPELRVEIGTKKHVRAEMVDFYNEPLRQGECYGVVQDFAGNETYVNFKNGNKDLFVPPMEKSLEYQELKKEQSEIAGQAKANDDQPSLDVGGIGYQIKKIFIDQNTVLSFAHDDILEDGSTFKEHLYNHKALEFITYDDFDLQEHDENRDGQIDEWDRVRLMDAITNIDNPNFNIDLLRDLVTEYYTKKIWMAWAKQFNFPEDWLHNIDVNRAKANVNRFKIAYDEAKTKKHPLFMFDGKQYGLKDADKFLQVALWSKNQEEVDYVKKYNLDK